VRLVEEAAEIVETLAPAARMLGAALAERLVVEVAEEASLDAVTVPGKRPAVEKPDAERALLLRELGHDPVTLDELVERVDRSAAGLSSLLLMLELDGLVERLPGNRYQRLASAR